MKRHVAKGLALLTATLVIGWAAQAVAENLFTDPSFEKSKPRDRWGNVFVEWAGFTQEGASCFEVGQVARTGNTSIEIVGAPAGKIRMYSKEIPLAAGRYRMTLYLRGLDIGPGRWGTNFDVSVDQKNYMSIKGKKGTFGWTPMTYVFDAPEGLKFKLAFGLWDDGRVWIDDASLEKVGNDVELTAAPVFGQEEKPVAMPGALPEKPVRCADCGYRNDPAWGKCYACGAKLEAAAGKAFASPAIKVIADFEDGKPAPFGGGVAVQEHATSGKWALRIDKSYASIDIPQDWSEHDCLHFDVFNPNEKPSELAIELRDTQTQDYWTRVNLTTIAPPGASTVTIPTALYVGEKSRPGRPLLRDHINRFVVSVGNDGPCFFDNFRLERLDTSKVFFDGLNAFQFKPQDAPKMEGFTACGRVAYSAGRGYGWTKADWWRDFNCLQPDTLYQSFVCPNSGTFRVDLPNGKYHVWMNVDSPGGYWGETQTWTNRTITANGEPVVDEKQDYDSYLKKYFRNASREDLPGIDTFKEYVSTMFQEKSFDVNVEDGKLELGFAGSGNWAICLSDIVIYPDAKKAEGGSFIAWATARRKAQFDDYFKQMPPLRSGAAKPATGHRLFATSFMQPVGAYDGPKEDQELKPGGRIDLAVAKGEEGALTFAVQPSGDMGTMDLAPSKLVNAAGQELPVSALRCGWLDYRISRVQMDGSVYTVAPRYWHPTPAPASPGVTRNFFVRVKTAADAAPGDYRGFLRVKPSKAEEFSVPVQVTVLPFALDPIADVAAGPWGCSIGTGWPGADPRNRDFHEAMFEKALDALKDLGCSSFSGVPTLRITAANGQIQLDAAEADKQMALIRAKGFTQMVSSYGANIAAPFNLYNGVADDAAKKMGFADAQALVTAMWKAVDDHAVEANWVPVAYNLCDEPMGAAIPGITRNAKMHRAAAEGLKRTTFMGATSMTGNDTKTDHYELVRSLPMPSLNLHDEASLAVIHDAGGRFSFYNGGNRWTFGRYMKFLVVKHHLELRNTWHYNVAAGDPYYALDCREDDYCWFNTNEKGDLIPSTGILCNVLPGLNDYRYFSTLQRLIKEKAGTPAAAEAKKVFDGMMDLKAGADRDHKADYAGDRAKVVAAIVSLLK